MLPRRWYGSALLLALLVTLAGCGNVEILAPPPAPGLEHCPTGPYGGPMVEVPAPQGGSYCIDRTEVTRASYLAWYEAGPELPADLPPWCVYYLGETPWEPVPGMTRPGHPVSGVSSCSAYAFCKANGKHLCGAIGGGLVQIESESDAPDPLVGAPQDPSVSEWFNACTAGGEHPFPYGDSHDASRCYDPNAGGDYPQTLVDAGSWPGCEGGYSGIFDMVGNTAEWTGAYAYWKTNTFDEGPWLSLVRGESVVHGCGVAFLDEPDARDYDVSFRCCADALPEP